MGMNQLQAIEHEGQRVLTTVQLAESYGSDADYINRNFNNNKSRYVESKHYFLLEGNELKEYKMTIGKNDVSLLRVNKLYLWTEKGAWLHAKSLNIDKAWDAYELLVDDYYNIKGVTTAVDSYTIEDPIQRAERWIQEQKEKKELETKTLVLTQRVAEYEPKATYYDMVLQNKSLLSVSKIAKDYGMSAMSLNKMLHENGVQYKQGDIWLLYAKHQDKGYTQTTTHVIDADNSKINTKWTQKGRLFIYDLLKNKGVYPMIERG